MKRLFAIALLLAGAAVRAQNAPTVTARIEPDSIMIGDRFDLTVEVDKDLVQVVQFPEFENKEGSPLELVKDHPIDTLERDGRHLRLRKRYTLAAFEEGKWNLGLPAVLYADKNIVDTLRARDSLYLEVATFQIDSTSQSIYDLKPQRNLPFRFAEVSGYAKWGVLALLLAGALAFGTLFGAVMYGAYDHIQGEPRLMVILGCQVKPWGPSILLQDRLDKALEYMKENPETMLVLSGAKGDAEPCSEADAMETYLLGQGADPDHLLKEEQSFSTVENLAYSRVMIEKRENLLEQERKAEADRLLRAQGELSLIHISEPTRH